MKAIGIIGHSDAGKTTLIERLVPPLDRRGRVATIKSIHHDIAIDEAGKDTHRHRTAGAEKVIGVTPSRTFSVESRGKETYDDDELALRRLLSELHEQGFDYVLVEGFSGSSIPKFALGDPPPAGRGRIVKRIADSRTVPTGGLLDEIDRIDDWRVA